MKDESRQHRAPGERPLWHRVVAGAALAFLLFMMFWINKSTLRAFAESYGVAYLAEARGDAITQAESVANHVHSATVESCTRVTDSF